MPTVYFDVTDIVYHATRYSTVGGIQRVQMNIISLLAQSHGGNAVRCLFYDRSRNGMFEFNPAAQPIEIEFNAESLLIALGLTQRSSRFPSQVQLKSHLRQYNHNKLLRTIKKIGIYLTALVAPKQLARMGLSIENIERNACSTVTVSRVDALPDKSHYVCMGSVWLYPEVWKFAQAHRSSGGDVVQMIHDLIPISHPKYLPKQEPAAFELWLTTALRYASRFISNSQWTARDLRQYAIKANAQPIIRTIALAHEFAGFKRDARIEMPSSLAWLKGATYVLCLGTIEYRKNGVALLKGWQQLIQQLDTQDIPLLVFAGRQGKGGAEVERCIRKNSALAKRVRVVHAPSDHEIAWLYGNCLFTTFPSLMEGWGLPVGEAAWFGKICVASKTTSIPEVCGELMDYIDPHDPADIALGLRRPIMARAYLKQREQRIAAAELRLWSDVASEIYEFVTTADGATS